MPTSVTFTPGTLIRARGREWIVLPESEPDLLRLRPLGGADDEVTGLLTALETVTPASFAPPDPDTVGDFMSCRLLRDAVRLGIRSAAGPFRSFGRLGVEPRPYQLVPLLMALRLDPVRMLIADDVGIGKTVEACLVARELLDRGEAHGLAVLCPPHLAEQWQRELAEKFHIEAELVLAGTASRLERGLAATETIFDRYRHVIVSLDFIKSERRRQQFLLGCPDLVIVDEAHTCSDLGAGRGRQQRHQLLRDLVRRAERHLLLVTATPHSGNDAGFRSLLGLLDADLANLPSDLSGRANETQRRKLARYLVQRRRDDLRRFMKTDTPFPERLDKELSYVLSKPHLDLFEKAIAFARETTEEAKEDRRRYRIRWWSMLALLRSLGSSPAAAEATLRSRARNAGAETLEEAESMGREAVLDLGEDQPLEGADAVPGSDFEEDAAPEAPVRRKLLALAREAAKLGGDADPKLAGAIPQLEKLVKDGFRPIVFCRFIDTAEYLGAALKKALKGVEIGVVTGQLAPEEREQRIAALAEAPKRVLVATDCLSEGINLQEWFDAVFHYDLSWNPTRHEQREGRVDRFGQARPEVRVVTYYGANSPIDGMVLDVLLRKHKAIRKALGISIPVPMNTEDVFSAIIEGLVTRGRGGAQAKLFEEEFRTSQKELHGDWDAAAGREERSRSLFAQETIQPDEVARELREAQSAVGAGTDLGRFVRDALTAHAVVLEQRSDGVLRAELREAPRALRDVLGVHGKATERRLRTAPPVADGEVLLTRTHPFTEALAGYVLDTALDPPAGDKPPAARRCGMIRTAKVSKRTTLLLARFRFDLHSGRGASAEGSLAEECAVVGFEGDPSTPTWLDPSAAEALLEVKPDSNVDVGAAAGHVRTMVEGLPLLQPRLEEAARERAQALMEAHERVRTALRAGAKVQVRPHLPVDVLGVYVFLPPAVRPTMRSGGAR